mmetsp:Transcript_89378/g.186782  ORF Transcript_89378/g.186782 Transcript_89378/m.186782 type:complete len:93 (-) Transcript_89378:395-673(-)
MHMYQRHASIKNTRLEPQMQRQEAHTTTRLAALVTLYRVEASLSRYTSTLETVTSKGPGLINSRPIPTAAMGGQCGVVIAARPCCRMASTML